MIKEFEIRDILGAVNSINKIEKKKNKIIGKKDSIKESDVLSFFGGVYLIY